MTAFDDSTLADAVIVIPGIMGSELVDTVTGATLWGLADAGWYVRAWTGGRALDALIVTDDERSGKPGRIRANRLLRFPAFAPFLRGFEPYTALTNAIRSIARHPAAVLPFPYDWRLPVTYNAQRLAEAADDHLRAWRAHPAGSSDARLVLVAHSMGGLLATYFAGPLGGNSELRTVVTLGTPFRGAVKAIQILNSGRGAPVPLPRRRLRRLAATLPGLHDLLPSYRCVAEGSSARRLTVDDVVLLGGDRDFAQAGLDLHDRVTGQAVAKVRCVVGVDQPTTQSLTIADGVASTHRVAYLPDERSGRVAAVDRGGDGTVYRDSATIEQRPTYFAQTHGALAGTPEAISYVRAVLTERELGPWLGAPPALGLEVDDLGVTASPVEVRVLSQTDPAAVFCHISDALTGASPVAVPLHPADGHLQGTATISRPGLYRVTAKGQGFSPVTELLMVTAPDTSHQPGRND